MKAIELMKSDSFFVILFALLSLFSISLIHFFVLTVLFFFFDTQYHLKLVSLPNFCFIISGLSFNFILFNWIAGQIEKVETEIIDSLSNSNIY